MNATTYPELRSHLWAMPIEKEVKTMAVAMTQKCEALGMTVSECSELIVSQMDEPKRIPAIKKLAALAMQTVSELQNMANYTEAMIVEQHNGCRVVVIGAGYENLLTIESFN